MPTKKIYTNTLAQIAGKVATALISIYLIKILTNYLDIEGYGLYAKIYNYLSIFAVIADLGLYTISVRELSKYQDQREQFERISGNILSMRTISGILIIGLSLAIAPFLQGYNSLVALTSILIVSLFTLLGLINSSFMSSLQASLKTEFSFIANTAGKICTFLLIIIAAFLLFPAESTTPEMRILLVFGAWLVGNILMTALTWWYARGIYTIRFSWNTDIILSMLTMALPYGIALFLGVIFFKVDIILLSLMEAPHEADTVTALYSLPMKIVEVGMMYGTIFLNSFLPVLTNTIEEKREHDTKKLALKGFELLMGFGAGISVFLACFASPILTLISHHNFVETSVHGATAVHAMQIIAWIFLFYFLSSLSNYILIAKNQQKKIIFVNLGIALFNIIGNLILIPLYSFIGAAYVTLASQILLVLINGYLVRRELPPKNTITLGTLLTASALICGYCALLGNQFLHQNFAISSLFIELTLTGLIFGIPYLGLWYLIGKMSQKNPT